MPPSALFSDALLVFRSRDDQNLKVLRYGGIGGDNYIEI